MNNIKIVVKLLERYTSISWQVALHYFEEKRRTNAAEVRARRKASIADPDHPGQFSCLYFTRVCRSARNAISAPTQEKGLTREDSLHGRSQDFPLGGGGVIVFIENCSLLVDRLSE